LARAARGVPVFAGTFRLLTLRCAASTGPRPSFLGPIIPADAFMLFSGRSQPWPGLDMAPSGKANFSLIRPIAGLQCGFPDPVPRHLCNFLALRYV